MAEQQKIANIFLDERTVVRRRPEVEHERKVAVFDLLEENHFTPVGEFVGPYNLHLSIEDDRLVFDVRDTDDERLTAFNLPTSTFRSIIKDYFMVCDSYYKAIKGAAPQQIEAVDMGRRSLHNEGTEMLRERLADIVHMDSDTARRLFTLICVLHIRA